ncbi:Uncharacterised protein [Acinetobacter baumannii]|nr:Uncharacterised protein [Acinetobacter baumannii]
MAGHNADNDPQHRRATEHRPDELCEQAVGKTRRRHLRQEGRRQDIAEAGQAVAPHQTLERRRQQQRLRSHVRAMQLAAARQKGANPPDQHQRQPAIHQPGLRRRQPQRVDAHRQHAAEEDAGARPGEHRRAQRRPAVVRQPLVGPGRHQHHRPAAGPADDEAQRAVGPFILRQRRQQRQHHRAPYAQPQAPLDVARGAHRVVGAAQVSQIVDRRHQPGTGQAELVVSDHQRHLRGESEAANAHRHDQRGKPAQGNT